MNITLGLSKIFDQHYEERNDTLYRYADGVSLEEHITEFLKSHPDVKQFEVWDNSIDIGPAGPVGITSVAWVDNNDILHLETYEWEE